MIQKCEGCGNTLIFDPGVTEIECEVCGRVNGQKEEKPAAPNINVQQVTNTVHADSVTVTYNRSDEMFESAKGFIETEQWERAKKKVEEYIDTYSQDYRAWWCKIRLLTHEFTLHDLTWGKLAEVEKLYGFVQRFAGAHIGEVNAVYDPYHTAERERLDAVRNDFKKHLSVLQAERDGQIRTIQESANSEEARIQEKISFYELQAERRNKTRIRFRLCLTAVTAIISLVAALADSYGVSIIAFLVGFLLWCFATNIFDKDVPLNKIEALKKELENTNAGFSAQKQESKDAYQQKKNALANKNTYQVPIKG